MKLLVTDNLVSDLSQLDSFNINLEIDLLHFLPRNFLENWLGAFCVLLVLGFPNRTKPGCF